MSEPKDPIQTPATPEAIFGKEAVAAALADHAAVQGLKNLITDAKWDRGELTLTVALETIVQACEAAKAAGYNFFEDLTGVDRFDAAHGARILFSRAASYSPVAPGTTPPGISPSGAAAASSSPEGRGRWASFYPSGLSGLTLPG